MSSSFLVGIPLDGQITTYSGYKIKLASSDLIPVLFNSSQYRLEGLNQFDVLKMIILSFFVPRSDRVLIDVDREDAWINRQEILDLFRDPEVINDKASIAIVNATDIDGLGASIAEIFKRVGYNVISVSTGNHAKSQIISRNKNSITARKLQSFFGAELSEEMSPGVSDITVIVAKDLSNDIK
jgi:hypothetical protein